METEASSIILRLFQFLLSLAGIIGIVGIVPFAATGIVFFVKSSKEQDPTKKKSQIKKGIIFLVLPFGLIIASLLLSVMVSVFTHIY